MKPQISIIVPVYNVQKYLNDCINSVIQQIFYNWELILVDDGSKDESGAICDMFAAKDSRITVVHQENSGVSMARNAGIKKSQGEYIFFLDSDDYIQSNALDVLHSAMVASDADCAILSIDYVFEGQEKEEKYILPPEKVVLSEKLNEIYRAFFVRHVFHSACGKLYRSDIIKKNDIQFEKGISILEDGMFVSDYLKRSDIIVTLQDSFYFYRQFESDSLMKRFNINAIEALEKKYKKETYLRNRLNEDNLMFYYNSFFENIWTFVTQVYSRSGYISEKKREILFDYHSRCVTKIVIDWLLASKKIRIRKVIKCWLLKRAPVILHLLLLCKY